MTSSSTDKPKMNNFQRIRDMAPRQQQLLSLVLIERMKPNYELFVELANYPQPHELNNILDALWQRLLVKGAKINLTVLDDKVEQLTPSEHEYEMYGVYPAIYFCTALLTFISGLSNPDDADAVAIAKISQGCVVHLIEYQNDGNEVDNKVIREHPLMALEVETLVELIDAVESVDFKLSMNDIRSTLLKVAFDAGVTNIGLEIE